MLAELNAIAFEHQITFESRTQPWVILAKQDGIAPQPFVVKLFSKKENENRFTVAKEVFANVIAEQLEISRPEAALINMNSSEFIATLPSNMQNIMLQNDHRIKFACKYIDGTLPFNSNVPPTFYDQFEDVDSIFAFDNLIFNTDRTEGNPDNLRFKGDSYYVIDHEFSLEITRQIVDEFENNNWIYPYANHIFYYYLLLKKDKTDFFRNFEDRLTGFDPGILDCFYQQLERHHYKLPYYDFELLKEYLSRIKAKSKTFLTLLQQKFDV